MTFLVVFGMRRKGYVAPRRTPEGPRALSYFWATGSGGVLAGAMRYFVACSNA